MNNLVSAKMDRKVSSLAGWHRYYAGYADSFVLDAFKFLDIRAGEKVLDPWSGSGTTGYMCASLGISAGLIDINPVMAIFGAAKLANPELLPSDRDFCEIIETTHENSTPNQFLSSIVGQECALFVSDIIHSINNRPSGESLTTETGLSSERSFMLAVVLRTLREIAGVGSTKNPSWPRFAVSNISIEEFKNILEINYISMLKDLQLTYNHTYTRGIQYLGNIVDMNKDIIQPYNCVISSPPYLTRIDYAVSTKLEISALPNCSFDSIRRSITGAPVICSIDHSLIDSARFGEYCSELLNRIHDHPSKASQSYYWKNIIQYFNDMYLSLCNMFTTDGNINRGLLVVQNSYYKEINVDIGRVIIDILEGLNFSASVVSRDNLTNTMTNVNSKSNSYSSKKQYSEDVISIKR